MAPIAVEHSERWVRQNPSLHATIFRCASKWHSSGGLDWDLKHAPSQSQLRLGRTSPQTGPHSEQGSCRPRPVRSAHDFACSSAMSPMSRFSN
jgi:hypothetical protein